MADQMTIAVAEPVRPDSLAAAERAVLLNIETHTDWSSTAVVTALLDKGLVARCGERFALTDHGRTALNGLLQSYQRRRRGVP
jgi:hypothetical protein